jgi:hypothetical protein
MVSTGPFVSTLRASLIGVGLLVAGAASAPAEEISRYRGYVLDSNLESVVTASGASDADVKTLHERPARIQEVGWRAPYVMSDAKLADPVRGIVFTFCDGALYQIVVGYDRARTDGLTNQDIINGVSAVYGDPVAKPATRPPAAAFPDGTILARWERQASSVTLVRDRYSRELQLILTSTASSARARAAIKEAIRLDTLEAPRRELQQRNKELADADAARAEKRTANKAAFRP